MKKVVKGALLIAAVLMVSFAYAGGGEKGEKTKSVVVDEATIVYRTYGNKPGVPLVLLAPLGSSLDDWDPAVINGLAKYSTVVLFDNKGVGSSTGKTPGSIVEMARDAVAFVRALGYPKVDLLGFSMGGFVAQEMVETEPALVNKVILVGTGPQGSEGLAEIGGNFRRRLT
jgi:pimeloyl-ACP methyl ester carboxylesterase